MTEHLEPIRPIKSEQDYEAALDEAAMLMDAEVNTPEGDRLDVLATLIDAYEARHFFGIRDRID